MLDLFLYGLQFSILAMIIVLFALYLLALLLMLFNKITSRMSSDGQGKGGTAGKGTPAKTQSAQARSKPLSAAPLTGEKPEVVAAVMGALSFALGAGEGRRFAVTNVARLDGGGMSSNWGQTGRSRLLQLRQDFVFSKRGKVR